MIQLTKGTNVLDINLSDFSGAGQDVVQNGSFDDIGSDLVQNGDFAEIGSELVTNGDFSEEGSNLITNPNFTNTGSELLSEGASPMTGLWGSNGSIIDGKLVKTALGIAYRTITYTEGKSYKAIIDVESLDGATNFWLAGTNSADLVVGINTIYIVAGSTAGYGAGINDGFSSGEGSVIKSISVKELGEDWTLGPDWSIANGKLNGINVTNTSPGTDASQTGITFALKSFQVVYTISNYSQGEANLLLGGYKSTPNRSSNGTFTEYITIDTANTTLYIQGENSFTGSISDISIKEVGQDWTVVGSDATHYVEFPGVGARYVAFSAGMLLAQTGIITPGKSYTVTCNVAYASGSGELRCQVGNVNSTPFVEGFNTVTVTATTGVSFYLVRNTSNVDCVITNVTLTQVGGGNLERWWRMNGSQGPTAAPPAPADYITANQAPNGIVNAITPIGSPLLDQDTP